MILSLCPSLQQNCLTCLYSFLLPLSILKVQSTCYFHSASLTLLKVSMTTVTLNPVVNSLFSSWLPSIIWPSCLLSPWYTFELISRSLLFSILLSDYLLLFNFLCWFIFVKFICLNFTSLFQNSVPRPLSKVIPFSSMALNTVDLMTNQNLYLRPVSLF